MLAEQGVHWLDPGIRSKLVPGDKDGQIIPTYSNHIHHIPWTAVSNLLRSYFAWKSSIKTLQVITTLRTTFPCPKPRHEHKFSHCCQRRIGCTELASTSRCI
jgi:hypothetical protein